MVPAGSRRVPRAPRYSGFRYAPGGFAHGALTRCGRAFQPVTLASLAATPRPYNPAGASPRQRFGLLPVRSPLLGESLLFSLPPGTKMFQFPGFAPRHKGAVPPHTAGGCPIRTPAGQWPVAPHRSFSQLPASFVASSSQGIRHAPLFTSTRPTQGAAAPAACAARRCILDVSRPLVLLQSCVPVCQRSYRPRTGGSGEYRIRTDGLLHAMQAL